MANTVPVIGIEPAELTWIRTLVTLLRHPDPVVPELTRQALTYLEGAASRVGVPTGRAAGPGRGAEAGCDRQTGSGGMARGFQIVLS